MSGESWRTLFMGISTLIGIFSFYSTISLWRKGNRPILSTFVETNFHSDGGVTVYNLSIINSGNRPAVNVYLDLNLSDEDFKRCITQEMDKSPVKSILRCFGIEETIPLIVDGEKKFHYFGQTSPEPEKNIWVDGISLPIEVNYQDLEGKKYISKFILVVKNSQTYLSTEWSSKKWD